MKVKGGRVSGKIKQNYVKQCLTEMGKMLSMKILSRRSKKTDESLLGLANSVTL